MSVLVHRCRSCAHPPEWHDPVNRGYLGCGCCRAGAADPDPEPSVQPTATSPGGRPEPLWPPGSRRNAGSMHAATTCGCDACHDAFRALVAETPGASDERTTPPRAGPERAAG